MLDKVKKKLGIKKEKSEELKQLEMIKQSLMDSLETRFMLEDAEGFKMENTQYINELIGEIDKIDKLIATQKEREREGKFRIQMPKIDGHIVGSCISGATAIVVALISYNFGEMCIKYDEDGNVVPTRLFGLGPKMPNVKP